MTTVLATRSAPEFCPNPKHRVTTELDPVVHAEKSYEKPSGKAERAALPHGLPVKPGNDDAETRSRDAIRARVLRNEAP
jgi:hypothetical protein